MSTGRGVICSHCDTELEGHVIIDDVLTCPECNKNFQVTKSLVRAFEHNNPTKIRAFARHVLHGIGILILLSGVMIMLFGDKKPQPKTADIDSYFSKWDGSNYDLVSVVKQSMNDPKSFEHIETRYRDNGNSYTIVMSFRGKNAFNALVVQTVTADLDKTTRQISNLRVVQ